jgi:sugar phosphate isomerase/epimerase
MDIQSIGINADAGLIDGNLAVLGRELDYYRDLGFTHVEIAPHGVGAIYQGNLDRERVREVQAMLAGRPFLYAVHGPNPLNLMNMQPDAIDRQGFVSSIEFTAAIGAAVMVYHAGRYLAEEDFLLVP